MPFGSAVRAQSAANAGRGGRGRHTRAVLFGGMLAGGLDIGYAMAAAAARGRSPVRAVQAVASGLLGAGAFRGGAATFLLGLGLHFGIACSAAAVYYLASRRLSLMRERVVVPGALFGVLVYLFMSFVVLPLSRVPFEPTYPPMTVLLGLAVHIVLVGVPIAAAVRGAWVWHDPDAADAVRPGSGA